MTETETGKQGRVLALWLRIHVPRAKKLLVKCLRDCSDAFTSLNDAAPEHEQHQTFSVEAIGSGKVLVGPLAFGAKDDVFTIKTAISGMLPACPVWSQRLFLGHGGQEIRGNASFAEITQHRHERNIALVLGRRRLIAFSRYEDAGLRSELKDLSSVTPQLRSSHESVIPPLIMGENVIVFGGVGHTVSLTIAILQMLDMSTPACEAVVMCPSAAVCRVVQNTLVTCSLGLKLSASQIPIFDDNADQKTVDGAKIAIVCAAASDIHRALPDLRKCKFLGLLQLREMWQQGAELVELVFEQLVSNAQIAIVDDPPTYELRAPGNIFSRVQDPVLLRCDVKPLMLSRLKHYYIDAETDAVKFNHLNQSLKNLQSVDIFVLCSTNARARRVYTWLSRQTSSENRSLHFLDPTRTDHATISDDVHTNEQRVFVTSKSCLHPPGGLPARKSVALNFDVPLTSGSYTVNSAWGYRNFSGTVVNFATQIDHELFEDLENSFYMRVAHGIHLIGED